MLFLAAAICQALAPPAGSAGPAPWRIDLNYAQSELTQGLPAWREVSVAVSRRFDSEWAATARVDSSERFGGHDYYGEVQLDRALGDASSAYLMVGLGPDAQFRPEAALRFGGAAWVAGSLEARTMLHTDLSWARYRNGDVHTLKIGAEQWFAGARASVNGRLVGVLDEQGEVRSGFALGGSWRALDRLDLRVSYADAPESDEGLTVDVRTVALGATFEASDALSLRAWVTHEARDAFDRSELSLGAAWRL